MSTHGAMKRVAALPLSYQGKQLLFETIECYAYAAGEIARTAHRVLDLLESIQADLTANMREQAKGFNLSMSELLVVRDVSLHSGTTMIDLCARLGFQKGNVSRFVERFRSQKERLSRAILALFKGLSAGLAREQRGRNRSRVEHTGFVIQKEQSSAGVRRIRAVLE